MNPNSETETTDCTDFTDSADEQGSSSVTPWMERLGQSRSEASLHPCHPCHPWFSYPALGVNSVDPGPRARFEWNSTFDKLPRRFASPGGRIENSPAFQRWVRWPNIVRPEGTAESGAKALRVSGRFAHCHSVIQAKVADVGTQDDNPQRTQSGGAATKGARLCEPQHVRTLFVLLKLQRLLDLGSCCGSQSRAPKSSQSTRILTYCSAKHAKSLAGRECFSAFSAFFAVNQLSPPAHKGELL